MPDSHDDGRSGDECVPEDLVWAAYRELQRTDRTFPVETLTLARDVLAVVLPLHEKQLREQLAAATALAEKAEALVADAEMRAEKFCGAFSDAGSLAYRRGKLLDAALTRQTELAKERDEATARAEKAVVAGFGPACCVCGRILGYRNYRDQLFCWPCADGEPKTADAPQNGRSEPVERSETPGGHGEGSNSSAGTARLSEPGFDYGISPFCLAPNPNGPLRCGRLRDHEPPHRRGERTWTDDTTEDGQHG